MWSKIIAVSFIFCSISVRLTFSTEDVEVSNSTDSNSTEWGEPHRPLFDDTQTVIFSNNTGEELLDGQAIYVSGKTVSSARTANESTVTLLEAMQIIDGETALAKSPSKSPLKYHLKPTGKPTKKDKINNLFRLNQKSVKPMSFRKSSHWSKIASSKPIVISNTSQLPGKTTLRKLLFAH